MPNLNKKTRPTNAVKSRAHKQYEVARAFKGMSRTNRSFYTSTAWRKIRAQVIGRDPLCVRCLDNNRLVDTTTVDHIVPINRGGARLDLTNLQGLCSSCHNAKSAKDKERYQ